MLAFVSLGVACVALSGSIEMDSQLIRSTTPWARHAMRWDEVEAIQPDPDARRRALGTSAGQRCGRSQGTPSSR